MRTGLCGQRHTAGLEKPCPGIDIVSVAHKQTKVVEHCLP